MLLNHRHLWSVLLTLLTRCIVASLKVDSCGGYNHTHASEPHSNWVQYKAMRDALLKTGRPIYYSICETEDVTATWTPKALTSPSCCGCDHPGDWHYHVQGWVAEGLPVQKIANSILVEWSNNVNDFFVRTAYGQAGACSGFVTNLDGVQDLAAANLSGHGHWVDMDMLTVGCNNVSADGAPLRRSQCPTASGGLSLIEQKAQFALCEWPIDLSTVYLVLCCSLVHACC